MCKIINLIFIKADLKKRSIKPYYYIVAFIICFCFYFRVKKKYLLKIKL